MAKLYSNGEGENGQGRIQVGVEPSKNRRMNTKPYKNPCLSPPLVGATRHRPSPLHPSLGFRLPRCLCCWR